MAVIVLVPIITCVCMILYTIALLLVSCGTISYGSITQPGDQSIIIIQGRAFNTTSATPNLRWAPQKKDFTTIVLIQNQSFELIADTGSSDTWIIGSSFLCQRDRFGQQTARNYARDGRKFGNPSNVETNCTEPLLAPTQVFKKSYGGNASISGVFQEHDLEVAGAVARNQKVAIVDEVWLKPCILCSSGTSASDLNDREIMKATPSVLESSDSDFQDSLLHISCMRTVA